MTTIVVFSDTHSMPLPDRLKSVAAESDCVIFLGDGISRLNEVLFSKDLHIVRGNCDFPYSGVKDEEVLNIDGVKIFICHGNAYHVKRDLLSLSLCAKELGCAFAFYGHTHVARVDNCDGVTLICPGSPTCPHSSSASYLYAVAHDGALTYKIVDL